MIAARSRRAFSRRHDANAGVPAIGPGLAFAPGRDGWRPRPKR